jgi:arylsulfatase
VEAGRTSDAIVSTLDVLPTFAALAGADVPDDRVLDGVDQAGLLTGSDQDGARDRFLYYHGGELQAVRQGPWKLRLPNLKRFPNWSEIDRGSQRTELYHLGRDLGETTNLADKQPQVVERLRAIAEAVPGS